MIVTHCRTTYHCGGRCDNEGICPCVRAREYNLAGLGIICILLKVNKGENTCQLSCMTPSTYFMEVHVFVCLFVCLSLVFGSSGIVLQNLCFRVVLTYIFIKHRRFFTLILYPINITMLFFLFVVSVEQ